MKNLILQVDIKLETQIKSINRFKPIRDMYDLSEHQAKKFANIWQTDYLKIEDMNFLPDKHPVYHRLKMFEMLEYDNILYLDMDAIIMPICPNPFQIFDKFPFSAVRNHDWGNETKKEKNNLKMEMYNKRYNTENYESFCSGVMFITKPFLLKIGNDWKKYLYRFDKLEHDQDIYNQLIVDHYQGKYHDMSPEWGAWFRNGKYIDHMGSTLRKIDFDIDKYVKKKNIDYEKDHSLKKFF